MPRSDVGVVIAILGRGVLSDRKFYRIRQDSAEPGGGSDDAELPFANIWKVDLMIGEILDWLLWAGG